MKSRLKLDAMIILLFLFIIITTVYGTPGATTRQNIVFRYDCPESCTCFPDTRDPDRMTISCKWPYFEPSMLANFTRNVTSNLSIQCIINPNGQSVLKSTLGSMTFKGFNELEELRISDCAIDALPEDTFTGLNNLRVLFLNGLNEPQIDAKIFTKIPQLGRLSITRSGMKMLPSGALCPLNSLQILSLSNNKLGDIRLGIHDEECQLENLVLLDVSWNQIRHIGSEDLRPFSKLRQMSAVGNQMNEIETQAFQSVPHIQHLDIESNLLRTAPAFPDSLLYLNLADNRFENLPVTVSNLENLVSLNLSRNEITPHTPFQLYSSHLETLDLSWNRFDVIPIRLFSNSVDIIKQLWMSGNQLEELEPQLFSNFSNLQILDLSDNRLKSLSEGMFDGLTDLNELRLANNTIYHVASDVFRPLSRKLHVLDMSGNRLAELPIALGRLSSVRQLDFSRNQISKTYKFNLNKIIHLTRLDLSNNHLEAIESYVVADCPRLVELNLRNNRLNDLSSDAFQKCPQLVNLDLSQNQLEDLNGALKDIRSLRHLNLTHNSLKMLEWSEFPEGLISLSATANKITLLGAVGRSRVRRLELQNNKISILLAEQLPETLEVLNISHNTLRQINKGTFTAMKQFKSVDLRDNQIVKVSEQSFASSSTTSSTIIKLYLSGNPLECSCESEWMKNATSDNHSPIQLNDFNQTQCRLIPKSHKSSQVDTFVPLSQLQVEDFVCEYKGEMCEPNCICCLYDYDDCDCRSKCPTGCKCFHDSGYNFNLVYCESNEESHIATPLFEVKKLPMHATHIHLRGINLPSLKTRDFAARWTLIELEINGTGLDTIESMSLNTLTALKSLSIVNNYINHLNGSEFLKAQNVTHLDLSNNRFGILESDTISTMFPDLEELKLNGNGFVDLPEALETWPNTVLKRVHLGTNPFRCDCVSRADKFKVQEWIREHAEMVVDLRQVVCVENVTKALQTNDTAVFSDQSPNEGSDLFIMPMQKFLKQANRTYCTKLQMGLFSSYPEWNSILIISLCMLMAVLLFIAVWTGVSIIMKSRRSLKKSRYRKSTASSSLLNGTSVSHGGISPHQVPQFNIFVSYSKLDTEIVKNDLYMPLIHQEHMSLVMLHNDSSNQYSAYTESSIQRISDDLDKQMKPCQMLIWYLTQNFIQNEWNYVAIKVALRVFVQDRRKCVVVLLGTDVNKDRLEPELGQMLRRNVHFVERSSHMWWNFLCSHLPRNDNSGDGTFGIGIDGEDNVSDTTQIYSDMYGTIVPSEVV